MPATLSTDLTTTVSSCDSTTAGGTWARCSGTSASNPLGDADSKVEGTGSVGFKCAGTVASTGFVGGYVPLTAAFDSTSKMMYWWSQNTSMADVEKRGAGGVTLALSSDTGTGTSFGPPTNYKQWYLNGNDDYSGGGWTNYVLDPSSASHVLKGTGVADLAAVKTMWFVIRQRNGIASTTALNHEVDAVRLGTGHTLTLSDGVAPGTMDDFYTYDSASAYGVVTRSLGIYVIGGKLNIGSTGQASPTVFTDKKQTILFKKHPVPVGLYEIVVAGNSTGPQRTSFQLGDYAPNTGQASAGCTVKGTTHATTASSIDGTTWRDNTQAMYNASVIGCSESFRNIGVGNVLDRARFWMIKTGSPPGNIVAKLYANTGTITDATSGGTCTPTGAALATSDVVVASGLTGTYAWYTFTFSGANRITLTDNTVYDITVEYSDAASNVSNSVSAGTDGTSSFLHGNIATLTGSTWTAAAATDLIHELYVIRPNAVWTLTSSNIYGITKIYNSSLADLYRANLVGNSRAPTVANCAAATSTTLTTTASFLTNTICRGMKITGTGISGNVWVASVESATSLTMTSVQTVSAGTTLTFTESSEFRGCTISQFGNITANGMVFDNCIFSDLVTTVPTSATYAIDAVTATPTITNCQFVNCATAIRWPINTMDPNGKLDGTEFTSGGTGHAIEFTGAATSRTLNNVIFSGYSGTGTNAAVYVTATEGTMTLTISGGGTDITGNIRSAGATVLVSAGARTVTASVTDTDGVAVTGTNVFLRAAAGGPFPYLAGVTSIIRADTLATVTHDTHGLATGDNVLLSGITDKVEDNRVVTITKTGDNTYTFTTTASGSTNYTGSIKATFVFLKGLATGGANNNEITMSRSIPSTQPVVGWARKSTSGALYKTGSIAGNVASDGNSAFNAVMISDD